MADVRPLNALHYNLDALGSLQDLASPPYDVIDASKRVELLERSPYNAVAIDLPKPYGASDSTEADGDPYRRAAETIEAWCEQGVLVKDREPAIWALTQDYLAPDGSPHTRHAILVRVRVEDYGAGKIHPHERTLPGPRQDRLELTQATRHNLSPIFSLSSHDAWPLVAPATQGQPWGEVRGDEGTINRVWRIGDPTIHAAVAERLADAEAADRRWPSSL